MKLSHVILGLIIGLVGGVLLMQSCSRESDLTQTIINLKSQIAEQQKVIVDNELENKELQSQYDSLLAVKQQIPKQIRQRGAEIDSVVKIDSSRAIAEYRRALQDVDELPDKSERLSYREITLGAKYISQIPKLELSLNIADSLLSNRNKTIENDAFTKKAYQEQIKSWRDVASHWENAYISTHQFSDDRIIVYGGIGVSYGADNKLQPTLQLGIGIRIVTLWQIK